MNFNQLQILPTALTTQHFICFHCSQSLDNFHSFATKILAIQKIIYPQVKEVEKVQNVQVSEPFENATIIEIEEIEVPQLETNEIQCEVEKSSESDGENTKKV